MNETDNEHKKPVKYVLLKGNSDKFTHPRTGKPMQLYRIIAQTTFETNAGWVNEGDIGGHISDEARLSQTDYSWVFNTAKLFDDAMLVDSTLSGAAQAFGQAILTDCKIGGTAQVHGNAMLNKVQMEGNTVAFGDGVEVSDTVMTNSASVCQNAKVSNCKLSGAARIASRATLKGCKVSDSTEITGTAELTNCIVSGRTYLASGKFINDNIHTEVDLNLHSSKA